MSDQFVGEIRAFAWGYAPKGWQQCNGQLLSVAQNAVLFSLIGTTYGGDGRSTFALPDLGGSVPLCCSALQNTTSPSLGQGLSNYDPGQFGGEPTHTLVDAENALHSHNISGDGEGAASKSPSGAIYRQGLYTGTPPGAVYAYSNQVPDVLMNQQMLGLSGGGQPHNNMMPYLTLNFCIALTGIFPQRP
jgi:microcystin-dependent protein